MPTTYLITGANRGIGFELTKVISLRPDTQIIATSRSDSKLLVELAQAQGNITILKVSVDDDESIQEFGEELKKINGLQIDYFISNAGIGDSFDQVYETEREKYINHWIVNALGPIEVFKVVKPFLAPKNKIIFISTIVASISGLDYFPISCPLYGASKLSLNYLIKLLSKQLDNSTVIAISPGLVDTDMNTLAQDALKSRNISLDVPSLSVSLSVEHQLKIYDNLKPEDNGKFFDYDGSEIGW